MRDEVNSAGDTSRLSVYYWRPVDSSAGVQVIKSGVRNTYFSWYFIALAVLPVAANAQSVEVEVDAEATVYENEPDDNGGIYGEICIGNLSGTAATRRAFVKFDLPVIPDGAFITRVEYNFIQVRPRGNCGTCPKSANIELRRVLEDWEEGLGGVNNAACGGGTDVPGVDWNNVPDLQEIISATEFLPSSSGADIVIDTDVGNDDDGLIDDVQAWVDNPASNYGWEYRVVEEDVADNARLINPGRVTVHWGFPAPLDFADGFEAAD